MLQFEGEAIIAAPVDTVRARVSDPAFLLKCVPDIEKVDVLEKDRASFTVRPGLTFVRGTLEMELAIQQAADAIVHVIKSKGIGATSEVETRLALAPDGAQTRLNWSAEIKKLTGLLKAVPQGLLKGAAQKVIGDGIAALQKEIASSNQ